MYTSLAIRLEFTVCVSKFGNSGIDCRILGSHSGGYGEYYLLEDNSCSPLKVNPALLATCFMPATC
jgi:hypothetical protein